MPSKVLMFIEVASKKLFDFFMERKKPKRKILFSSSFTLLYNWSSFVPAVVMSGWSSGVQEQDQEQERGWEMISLRDLLHSTRQYMQGAANTVQS